MGKKKKNRGQRSGTGGQRLRPRERKIKERVRAEIKAGRRLFKVAQRLEKDFGISDTDAISCVFSEYRETIRETANLR